MSVLPIPRPISIADFLEGELVSPIKHEYLGGVVYAMAGARIRHNVVATNVLVAMGLRLRGTPCRPFNSDTKVRVQSATHTRFYYPDASVVCESNDERDSYQDRPVVVVEVLSDASRRIDEGEKKDAYLSLASLQAYVLIEQDRPLACVYRRVEQGFEREWHAGLEAVIPLGEVGTDLPLAEIYEGVAFQPPEGVERAMSDDVDADR